MTTGNSQEILTRLEAVAGLNTNLGNAVGALYQISDRIPGGTAGALRDAVAKGAADPGHFIKAVERVAQLKELLGKGLCGAEKTIANALLEDLQAALPTKRTPDTMTTELEGRNIVDAMLESLPELRSVYDKAEEFSGKQFGAHIVYGDVLLRGYLAPFLSSPDEDSATLTRVFDFLERIAVHGDAYAREVIRCSCRTGSRNSGGASNGPAWSSEAHHDCARRSLLLSACAAFVSI